MPLGLEYADPASQEGRRTGLEACTGSQASQPGYCDFTPHCSKPLHLSLLPLRTKVYTRLDLKDAFFCIRLAPASQPIFAFEWEDPVGGTKQQLTWTPLQGFKNFPTIFGEALASDLDSSQPENDGCWLLQYMDDVLLAAETKGKCWEGTKAVLLLLMEGYRMSKKKAQLCKEAVRHLGFVLKKGTRLLGKSRNEVILRIPTPKTRRQVWEFLGATGFCRIWIPGYSQMAHPLCELLIGPKQSPVHWTGKQQKACDELSLALLSAPALGLPDLAKPFPL